MTYRLNQELYDSLGGTDEAVIAYINQEFGLLGTVTRLEVRGK